MVEGVYLKITDRKKEILTSGGKYIAPQVMENKFKESRLIEQIMVLGEGEKAAGAFIIPDFQALSLVRAYQIDYTTDAQIRTS